MDRGRVGAFACRAETEELFGRAQILRDELDETGRHRGKYELAGADLELAVDLEATVFEGLAVDLRKQRALREVEGPNGDGVVIERGGSHGLRRRPARGEGDQKNGRQTPFDRRAKAHARPPRLLATPLDSLTQPAEDAEGHRRSTSS